MLKFRIRALFCVLLVASFVGARAHAEEKTVSQASFNRLVAVMKRMLLRIDELETQLKAGGGAPAAGAGAGGNDAGARQELAKLRARVTQLESQLAKGGGGGSAGKAGGQEKEGAVNLDDLDNAPAASGPSAAQAAAGKSQPLLHVYFDLDFYGQPHGNAPGSGLTFDNFHSFVFLDVMPTEDIRFSTSIETPPKFYELDYRLFGPVTLRLGKIWIPFDDLTPHSIYGGLTNVSRIIVGENFLPDLFTDLGVGVTWKTFDSPDFELQLDGYVVNGFQSGGKDPVTPGSLYPDFGTLPTGPDNNTNKSWGGRAHTVISHFLGLGVSYYTGRWTAQTDERRNLSMIGADSQIYLTKTTAFRGGFATMDVKLPSTASAPNYLRNGTYAEIGQKFGATDQFTFLLRGGTLNLDDRIVDRNDKQIGGAKLVWKPNALEWSIEHSHDFKKVDSKQSYDFTNFRVVASF